MHPAPGVYMKVITVANLKGGCGKSSITRNLAVAAGQQAAIIDLDPQGTLSDWLQARTADFPTLVNGITPANLHTALDALSQDYSYLFIDTPPAAHAWIGRIMALSDLVLIPVKPSPDDLRAVGETLSLLDNTNFAFVLNQAIGRARITNEAARVLAQHGKVAPSTINYRVAFQESAGSYGVTEKGDKRSKNEVLDLLAYVNKQLGI